MKKRMILVSIIISFLPLLFLVTLGIYKAVTGYDVYTMILPTYVKTIYGWEAFLEVVVWYGIALTFIPVLPICLLYQLIMLSVFIVGKIKKKKASETQRVESTEGNI